MLPAVVRFRPREGKPVLSREIEARAEAWLAMLWKNGQVRREWILGWRGKSLCGYVGLPEADALEGKHATTWVAGAARDLEECLAGAPEWEVLADIPPVSPATWESAKSLILITSVADGDESPVGHGESGGRVPIYTLPLEPKDKEALQSWAEDYRCADGLWIRSRVPEASSYRLLADPRSPLMEEARRLASRLAEAADREVFVHLFRHYALEVDERLRPCPLCGGSWKQRPGRYEPLGAWDAPFRCDNCGISSTMGVDLSDPRLAAVGTYRPPREAGAAKSPAG